MSELGDVPPGFLVETEGRVTAGFREDWAQALDSPRASLWAAAERQKADGGHRRGRGGGGSVSVVELGGRRLILRRYLHGGLTSRCVPQTFPTPGRLVGEMRVCEHARRAGVPVPTVIGGIVEKVWWHVYRLWILTEELADVEDGITLWRRMEDMPEPAREPLKSAVLPSLGRTVRALHRAKVFHADLHLKNILFRDADKGMECFLVDFDNSRILDKMTREARIANLRRLVRSVGKRDPAATMLTGADRLRFLREYLAPEEQADLRTWAEAIARRDWWHELWRKSSRTEPQ